ncbi:hypothetical protein ACQPZX_24445 [Actinoplanes sp. CA-142083]|uniref:hypothetical protein n=1 Tax=Actinoplanes sp. CA-142083 TaxID=3239903 RepID=UPI003D8EADC2
MTDHHDFSFEDEHSPPPDDHLAWDSHDPAHDPSHDFDAHDFESHDTDADGPHEDGSASFPADSPSFDDAHLEASHVADADHPGETASSDDAALVADTHGLSDISDLPGEEMFPPSVDVGELPEPVDGMPWIDTGSLGLADISAALHDQDHTDPVRPEELAEYAGTDLPPGADPWAVLADSDDPATAALAKWWQQN